MKITDEGLYQPATNIAVGTEYMAELSRMFAGLPEAIAASYNGGEDNVARWLGRSNQSDAGVFRRRSWIHRIQGLRLQSNVLLSSLPTALRFESNAQGAKRKELRAKCAERAKSKPVLPRAPFALCIFCRSNGCGQ
mgnify:CR=1 FL=1